MRSQGFAASGLGQPGQGLQGFLLRQAGRGAGLALIAAAGAAVASLATWNIDDPSFSNSADTPVTNALGYPGAVFSDLAMQFFGLGALAALVPAVVWGVFLASGRGVDAKVKRGFAWLAAAMLSAAIAGCFAPSSTWPLPTGLGGVFGDIVLKLPALALGGYPSGLAGFFVALSLALPGLALFAFATGIVGRRDGPLLSRPRQARVAAPSDEEEEGTEAGDRFSLVSATLGGVVHLWLSGRSLLRRLAAQRRQAREQDDYGIRDENRSAWRQAAQRVEKAERAEAAEPRAAQVRVEPGFAADEEDEGELVQPIARRAPYGAAEPVAEEAERPEAFDDEDDALDFAPDAVIPPHKRAVAPAPAPRAANPGARPAQVQAFRSQPGARFAETTARPVAVEAPAPRLAAAAPAAPPRSGTSGTGKGNTFEMPALTFLSEPKALGRDATLSKDALQQNARTLEGVLEDFGVKGEILQVRPGPVVTLYELEPAPGIKSSRVIGLSDDIARSMSAIAARVAVVPGRNAIGIELPNQRRETVYLREMLASKEFNASPARLALALGKTINGEPVVVDIAKMPHVLVAGTTGSGKSVAINTMVLSLLYKLKPEQCRLIMIDPKMVELSVYDGIPHLLTPVVTDPKKAVVALKWTVREMEDRYRKMAKVGVRNIDGFNARVASAAEKGEKISRTVQTGFDKQTGEAVYETEEMDLQPFPFIVVIIDEVADLMMVAGKDIEGAVQRLGQMARAAGIHVIMATQRPSVDVITGTIKANFPTRMSFQVTSKIDSRTILGEQGAEQLLGQGDMLYMAGGGRIQRVHGPFVSDVEVEKVVKHLKLQGVPEYLDAIVEDDEEEDDDDAPRGKKGAAAADGEMGSFDESEDPYDQAVAVVLRDGKASTSYIQRRLGIGYNRAASIIEKMEKEGIVGPANHAGKREILVPTEDGEM